MPEPVPTLNGDTIDIYYVVEYNGVVVNFPSGVYLCHLHVDNGGNYVFVPTFPSGNNSNQRLYLTASNSNFSSYVDIYNVSDGNLIYHYENLGFNGVNTVSGYYNVKWSNNYFPRTTGIYSDNDFVKGYWILPDNLQIANVTYPQNLNTEPFVQWSKYPPKHNIYHSHLSEPVADEFNRYFIINDKLYWLSFRLQGVYVLTEDIKTETEVESYIAEGDILGTIQNPESELVLLGSEITYKDMEVYPVFSKYETLFDSKLVYPALYYNGSTTELRLNLDQYGLVKAIGSDHLFLDAQVYLSCFSVEDGSYISSRFYSVNQNVSQHLIIDNTIENPDDIKCYGIDFLNVNATPVNLSDVQWNYDIEFAQWRDNVLSMLENIYKVLGGEELTTESFSDPEWGNELQHAEPTTRVSQQEMGSVFNNAFQVASPDPELKSTMQHWVNLFSNYKLIAASIFALTMGTIILTIGKKKSD